MVTEQLGTFLQYGSSYNWCPGSPVSEHSVTGTWTVSRLPLTPKETQTLASEAAQSPPAWCSFHAWETSGWEGNPLQLSDSTCIVSLGAQLHPTTQRSICTTICHCQPGEQLHSSQEPTNTRDSSTSPSPSYPTVTEPLGTGAAWSLVGKAQPFAGPKGDFLTPSHLITCSFKGEWKNLGESLPPTSNTSDKMPVQKFMRQRCNPLAHLANQPDSLKASWIRGMSACWSGYQGRPGVEMPQPYLTAVPSRLSPVTFLPITWQ